MDHTSTSTRQCARDAIFGVVLAGSPVLLLLVARPFGIVLPKPLYLPVHSALEMFVAAAGVATFAVQWFAAGAGPGAFRDARARFLGPAFLAAAVLELAHLLSFPGMPGLLGPGTTERGIWYWLAARAFSVGALVAALAIDRESERPLLRRGRVLAVMLAAAGAVIAVELSLPLHREYFFVEPTGLTPGRLTPLKVGLEGAIAAAATLGALLHLRAWSATRDPASARIALSLAMAVYGETCFMLYRHPYDPFNVLGHAYVVASFWFAFDALFVAALLRPYQELDRLRAHVENELVVTIRRLRQTTEQREDLLRAVSHDLRNPLQIVLLQAQRLLRPADDPARRSSAAIVTAARRMDRMLRDLSDSARAESGNLELGRAPLQLHGFVGELLDSADGVLDAGRVENAVPPSLPPVLADPDRLDRILTNLVGNALKYTSGVVAVYAEASGVEARISVVDRGPGIGAEDLPRIFDRYYRGQRHEGEGLGLGLFIVRKLVEAHGGTIWADSRPGAGSTFTFTLPLASADIGRDARRAADRS